MEKLEGGLTQIEFRAFKEQALGAGSRDSVVYLGPELSIYNFDYDDIKKKIKKSLKFRPGLIVSGKRLFKIGFLRFTDPWQNQRNHSKTVLFSYPCPENCFQPL